MKKLIIIIIGLISFQFGSAQLYLGPNIGLDINNVQFNGVPDIIADESKSYLSPSLGIHGEYTLNNTLSAKAELNYRQRGFTIDQSDELNFLGIAIPLGVKAQTIMHYVELPLLLKYKITNKDVSFFAEAGPSISYALSGNIDLKASALFDLNLPSEKINFSNDGYNRFNYAAAAGIGAETKLSEDIKGFAGIRYTYSLNNILNDPLIGIDARAHNLHIGIGVSSVIGNKSSNDKRRKRK